MPGEHCICLFHRESEIVWVQYLTLLFIGCISASSLRGFLKNMSKVACPSCRLLMLPTALALHSLLPRRAVSYPAQLLFQRRGAKRGDHTACSWGVEEHCVCSSSSPWLEAATAGPWCWCSRS